MFIGMLPASLKKIEFDICEAGENKYRMFLGLEI